MDNVAKKIKVIEVYDGGDGVTFGLNLKPDAPKENIEDETLYTVAIVERKVENPTEPQREPHVYMLLENAPGKLIKTGKLTRKYLRSAILLNIDVHIYGFLVYEQKGKIEFNEADNQNSPEAPSGFSMKKFVKKYDLAKPIIGKFYQAQFEDGLKYSIVSI